MKPFTQFTRFLLFAQIPWACATPQTITFRSDLAANVAVVGWDSLDSAGASLGMTPLTLPLTEVKDKPIRVTAHGMSDQYWVFTEQRESSLDVALKLRALADTKEVVCNSACRNRNSRLILSAYEALSRNDIDTALSIADQLSTVAPDLAAPHILRGLAKMHRGDNQEAHASFVRARALDPGDPNVAKLLRAIR